MSLHLLDPVLVVSESTLQVLFWTLSLAVSLCLICATATGLLFVTCLPCCLVSTSALVWLPDLFACSSHSDTVPKPDAATESLLQATQ